MKRIGIAFAVTLALAGCGGTAASPSASAASAGSAPASEAAPTVSQGLSADARGAVCETFRIVEEEIRPSYDQGFEAETPEDFAELGAVVSAGGIAIAALADDVSDPTVAEMIRTIGDAYEAEGAQVAAREQVDATAADALTDLVIAYGDAC